MNTIHPKAVAAGLGGAVSIVIVWVLTSLNVDVTPEVASAFTTILSFVAGYLKGA